MSTSTPSTVRVIAGPTPTELRIALRHATVHTDGLIVALGGAEADVTRLERALGAACEHSAAHASHVDDEYAADRIDAIAADLADAENRRDHLDAQLRDAQDHEERLAEALQVAEFGL